MAAPLLSLSVANCYSVELSDSGLLLSAPIVGLGFDVSEAEEPSGAELCSFAPPELSELWPSVDF